MKRIKPKIEPGCIVAYRDEYDRLHNNFGPAVVYPNGSKEYYFEGILHSYETFAIQYIGECMISYIDGELIDLEENPCAIFKDGKVYYANDDQILQLEDSNGKPMTWLDLSRKKTNIF